MSLPLLGRGVPAAQPIQKYVSTTGSDSTGDGSVATPWATVDHARASIRSSLAAMTSDIQVNVAPGDYWNTSVAFTDADNGKNGHRVIYRASGAYGTAHLYGGRALDPSGWSLYSGSIYRRALAGTILTTMWENGVRARSARTPAFIADASFPMSQAPYLTATGVASSQTVVQYGVGALSPAAWDLNSAQVAIWGTLSGVNNWLEDVIPVASVDIPNRKLTLSANIALYAYASVGARFYVQGAQLADISGPGQFFHDVASGYLYYWPNSAPIASQTIVVPTVDSVVSFVGSSAGTPCSNITLSGLGIAYGTALHTYQTDSVYYNAGRYKACVFMQNTSGITVSCSEVFNAGLHGIYMHSACTGNLVERCSVHNTADSGIYIENFPGNNLSPDLGNVSTLNIVAYSKVHHTGELYGAGHCIHVRNSSYNTLTHLELYQSPRAGFYLYGGDNVLVPNNYALGNVVQYVAIHDVVQDSDDMGGLYMALTASQANTFNQITVDNSRANASVLGLPPTGVYTDAGAPGQVFTNINCTNIQGSQRFNNSGGGSTETNCSWNGGFNSALMDPTIGATTYCPW